MRDVRAGGVQRAALAHRDRRRPDADVPHVRGVRQVVAVEAQLDFLAAVQFEDLGQPRVELLARLDTRAQIDVRLAKVFKLNGRKEVEASLDGYNLANSAYVWDVRTGTTPITVRETPLARMTVPTMPGDCA